MGVLLILALIAGAVYVYFADRQSPPTQAASAQTDHPSSIPEPTQPGPNAPESASVQYIENPVAAGQNSTITVITGPLSKCTIVVEYNGVVTKDSGLAPKSADNRGSITWAWTVPKAATPGKWPAKVTCVRNGKTGYVEGTQQITK
jgi:hypothetical protein